MHKFQNEPKLWCSSSFSSSSWHMNRLLENISKQTEVHITLEVSLVPSLRKKWKVDKQELTSIEWTFLAICLVSSIVMIFFLQMKLLQGKRDTLISQQFLLVSTIKYNEIYIVLYRYNSANVSGG